MSGDVVERVDGLLDVLEHGQEVLLRVWFVQVWLRLVNWHCSVATPAESSLQVGLSTALQVGSPLGLRAADRHHLLLHVALALAKVEDVRHRGRRRPLE